jgi:amino acid transporter
MYQSIIILGYCVFSFVVSAVVMKFLKTTWVYFLISATLPPMVLMAVDAVWRGYLDTWASIAFVVSWLIAFGCALVYYVIIRLAGKRNGGKTHPEESTLS